MKSEEAYALARKYTDDSMAGAGAVAGKPCQIQSITDITGGHRVTFLWLDNNGVSHTSTMDVMNGDKGETGDDGLGIKSVDINAQNHLIVTYDDDTTHDAGELPGGTGEVVSVNGKKGVVVLDASDVGALSDDTEIPAKTSELTNDSIVDSASYDSTNHQILFKNGTTTLFSLDAAAFVKDGMVDDVEISGGNLVITFNTDAGKQDISIPLTDIFDPANYYDKDDVDGLLADKADKVASATNGDFAGLDANGNLTDSGKKASDFGTADEIADIVNVYGAKNLIPYPYAETTKTTNGITFTDNGDGTITINGTATATTFFYLIGDSVNQSGYKLSGDYIISTQNYISENSYLRIGITAGSYTNVTEDKNVTFPQNSDIYVAIRINNGEVIDNVTLYPMLRMASVKDNTYVPYVPTNAKLDEEKVSWNDASESVQKNLIVYPYNKPYIATNGITFTDLGDGSIKANGTATADAQYTMYARTPISAAREGLFINNGRYYLSGCPDGGADDKYFIQVGATISNAYSLIARATDSTDVLFTINGQDGYSDGAYLSTQIIIKNGTTVSNIVFKPMIRKATIKDDTYQPYIPNNKQLVSWKANGVLGAKNLIPYPYYDGASKTTNGITYIVNSDGSVTANGTATADTMFLLRYRETHSLKANVRYRFTGCPSGGSNTTYYQWIGFWSGSTNVNSAYDTGSGADLVVASASVSYGLVIGCYVKSGQTVSNMVFKPMLRLAEDTDDTYQPYAMTNRELTEEVNALPREIFVTTDTRTTTTNDANTLPCGFTRMNDANSNLPTDGTGGNVWYDILTVRQSNDSSRETWGYGFQLAVQTTTNANMGDMYVRAVNGGATPTWSEWKKLN